MLYPSYGPKTANALFIVINTECWYRRLDGLLTWQSRCWCELLSGWLG